MSSPSSALRIARGVLALIVGLAAITWPGVTVLALVLLFALFAFMDAGLQGARAFTSRKAGPVLGHLLLVLLDIGAGLFAVAWPVPTALVLVIVVAAWAFVAGFFEIFAAFQPGERARSRALLVVGGLVSIAFGVLIGAWPGLGVLTLALLFGLFGVFFGVSQIVTGFESHWAGRGQRADDRGPGLGQPHLAGD
jgi:uncharacterized membrane protein HdeD (DUF308 family)